MDVSTLSNLARLSTLSQLSGLSSIGGLIGTPDVQSVASLGQLQTSYVVQLSALGRLEGAFSALQTAAAGLTPASIGSPFGVQSFNAAVVTATANSTATPGYYSIGVSQLAQAQTLTSAGQVNASAPIGSGLPTTLTFQFGATVNGVFTPNADQPTQFVTINANSNSLQGIAASINNADIGVTAGVVNSNGLSSLQLTSAHTGTANTLQVTVTGDAALQNLLTYVPGGTQALTETTVAQNAQFTVNGVALESQSDTVDSAIPGVTLNLAGTGSANINVVSNIQPSIDKVASFVNAYNTLQTQLNAYAGGGLQNDFLVTALQGQLPSLLLATPSGGMTLGQIGITVNANNTLSLNQTTLESALQNNAAAVAQVFSNSGTGVADQVNNLALLIAGPGGALASDVAGLTQSAQASASGQLNGLFGASSLETQLLVDQFLGLGSSLGSLQSTDLFLLSLLNPFSPLGSGSNTASTLNTFNQFMLDSLLLSSLTSIPTA